MNLYKEYTEYDESDDCNGEGIHDLLVQPILFLEDEIEIVLPGGFELNLRKETCFYGESTDYNDFGNNDQVQLIDFLDGYLGIAEFFINLTMVDTLSNLISNYI